LIFKFFQDNFLFLHYNPVKRRNGMQVILKVWSALCFVVFTVGVANAAVVDFDNLSPVTNLTGTGYGGLTWGTSTDDSIPGYTGSWYVNSNLGYSTPHSPSNYVVNAMGPNNLWFGFSSPVTFNGAWFARSCADYDYNATQVRLRDDDQVSDWLILSVTPQFLSANFTNSTTVWVERSGGAGGAGFFYGNARWFTMDDITYNASSVPESATMLLLGFGLIGLVGLRRRMRKYAIHILLKRSEIGHE
jgi:hypothetical protein